MKGWPVDYIIRGMENQTTRGYVFPQIKWVVVKLKVPTSLGACW